MKAKFWFVFFIAIFFINLAWIWRINQNSKEQNIRMNDNRTRFIQTNRELYLMNRGWEFAMKSNDQPLPVNLWIKSIKGDSIILNKYLGDSKRLVLVLSDLHCSTCVDQLLFIVKNEINEQFRHKVLILFSASGSTHQQWEHRQKILPGSDFLEIPDQSLHLPMDSLENPYFFITGPDNRAKLTYTPYPSLEAQTKVYLTMIKERFF
jgi:hypothetical protein